ncbi:hypothetical protein L3X38_011224 [Prunus dulcis]|uniref:Uncharacterized protein n=1 Tax=Prunus dulcis TaxID=3755 RepID=A0AAD4WHU1_PRUDU|nr:hypothetical protein L3X38_011224 [Prunus dulcis]
MALKAEFLEKEKCQTNYRRNTMGHSENVATFPSDKGKNQQQNFGGSSKPSNLQRHRSNVCPEQRQANYIEDVSDDEVVDDDYAGAEFAIEEGMERLTLVLQHVLLAPKDEGQ